MLEEREHCYMCGRPLDPEHENVYSWLQPTEERGRPAFMTVPVCEECNATMRDGP